MEIPVKELNNGFRMPVFGMGTWLMGGNRTRDPHNNDQEQVEAIRKAIELGITLIDTAENYAEGQAEKIVGQAINGFDRKKLFITTKIDRNHLNYADVLQACRNSLKRLKTDYLDLYLIHSPNDEIPLSKTLKAMDKLLKEGFVRNIGVSNFKTKRLIYAQKLTSNKIVTNQVYYNVYVREPEKEGLLSYCQNNDVILTAYRPFDKGMLLTNINPLVKELSNKYKKTPAQIMLNWLISQKNVVVISKMSQLAHIKENLGALNWRLDDKEIELIRKKYSPTIRRSVNLPLQ